MRVSGWAAEAVLGSSSGRQDALSTTGGRHRTREDRRFTTDDTTLRCKAGNSGTGSSHRMPQLYEAAPETGPEWVGQACAAGSSRLQGRSGAKALPNLPFRPRVSAQGGRAAAPSWGDAGDTEGAGVATSCAPGGSGQQAQDSPTPCLSISSSSFPSSLAAHRPFFKPACSRRTYLGAATTRGHFGRHNALLQLSPLPRPPPCRQGLRDPAPNAHD